MPPAPPMFSTITVWPRISPMRCAITRPSTSVGPPAANGMIIVTARSGKPAAPAVPVSARKPASAAAITVLYIVTVTPLDGKFGLSGFDYLFRKLMQAIAGSVAADKVIVAQPVQVAAVNVGGVDDDVHVLLDRHRFVVAHQRPLDQVVPLAVAIEPRFRRPAILAHEGIELVPDVFARRARLEQVE